MTKFDATEENINKMKDENEKQKMQVARSAVDLLLTLFPNVMVVCGDSTQTRDGKFKGGDHTMMTLALRGMEGTENKKDMIELYFLNILEEFFEKHKDDLLVSPEMAVYLSFVTMAGYYAHSNKGKVKDLFHINDFYDKVTKAEHADVNKLSKKEKKELLGILTDMLEVAKEGAANKTERKAKKCKKCGKKSCGLDDVKSIKDLPKPIRDKVKDFVKDVSDNDGVEVLFAGDLNDNTKDILEKLFSKNIQMHETDKGEIVMGGEVKYEDLTDDQVDALSKALGIDIREKVKEADRKHCDITDVKIGAITFDDEEDEDDDD